MKETKTPQEQIIKNSSKPGVPQRFPQTSGSNNQGQNPNKVAGFPIIECHNVCKSFGVGSMEVKVLKSINLKINKGEFMMLVGPSGCGKTTLISILAGILPFDDGRCIVGGHHIANMKEKELLKFRAKNIGFVFQQFNLIPTLTVAENVAIPLMIGGIKRSQAIEKAGLIIKAVGLEDKQHMLPTLLSGGQQQRVAIARALVHSPKILICDEPTSALDMVTGVKIVELLRTVCKKLGTTFVVVTHDNRIIKYADRIVHLDDGVITKETNNGNLE